MSDIGDQSGIPPDHPSLQPPSPVLPRNGQVAGGRIEKLVDAGVDAEPWPMPPFVPPPDPKQTVLEPDEVDLDECSTGFWSNLLNWFRTRRERRLLVKVRRLELERDAAREERDRLGEMLENMRRWTLASTIAAERVAAQFGAPVIRPPEQRRTGGAMHG